ncbi:MAG: M23 family metallopeptidase, partial [Sphingomonadaceae bacterium]|nr:M23 family metallopeptidase [Sphingomonadaceae bacterium]
APGEALLVTWQVFAYTGPREALRVRVRPAGELGVWAASADLPVVGMSTHSYRFPMEGVWFIGAGASLHSHHRWMIAEEFGLDILRIGGDGATHRGDGSAFSDYLAYSAEVRAAAAGEVVAAVDGIAEDLGAMQRAGESDEDYNRRLLADQARRLSGGDEAIIGNHVVIRHQGDEYSVYAHLQPGSVRVRVGQELAAGEVLGLLGSSGNSTEPHLHFQLCDGPRPLHCAGIPIAFEGFDAPPQTGDIVGGE